MRPTSGSESLPIPSSATNTKASRKPQLPEGVRIYAVGDIHGRADLLQDMFAAIDHHLAHAGPARSLHVFLGDYVDRGPCSRQTIDLLIDRSRHHDVIFLKGNHEAFLLEVLENPDRLEAWTEYGGMQTLMSYGITPSLRRNREERLRLVEALAAAMPSEHRQFLSQLRTSFTCGDFFFVHAGVRPGIPLRRQREADLLWIRDEFLRSERRLAKFIVHGHTPVLKPDIRSNRINIDTGAYATGVLTLLLIEGDRMSAI
jgi:calcineurin-like phosphoesterase family protein